MEYPRRTLLHTQFSGHPSGSSHPLDGAAAADGGAPGSNFDANIVMILAVLLCALICALGLNSIVRCALRCSSQMVVGPEPNQVTRLAQSGQRRKALRGMPIQVYSAGLKLKAANPMCAICLSDFEAGELLWWGKCTSGATEQVAEKTAHGEQHVVITNGFIVLVSRD